MVWIVACRDLIALNFFQEIMQTGESQGPCVLLCDGDNVFRQDGRSFGELLLGAPSVIYLSGMMQGLCSGGYRVKAREAQAVRGMRMA